MEVIKTQSGKPFASREAAEKAMGEAELHADMWGIYPAPAGSKGFILAKHADMILQLNAAIEKMAADQATEKTRREAAAEAAVGSAVAMGVSRWLENEQYWWVQFSGRSDTREAEHIELNWEGDRITCRREHPICLPQRYLNVADTAVQQLYEPTRRSENPYRKGGVLKRRSYVRLREGTREEFLTQLKEGNDITRRDVELASQRADD